MYNPSDFNESRPNVGVTIIPIIYQDGELKVLAYGRPNDAEEFPNTLAFPNCFFDRQLHDSAEEAATNALSVKVNAKVTHFEQLETFSGLYIDPNRITTINIAYFALLKQDEIELDDDSKGKWLSVNTLLGIDDDEFAFNHKEVLVSASERICAKADYSPIALNLLPNKFTINDFLEINQVLMGQGINEKTFRTKLKKSGLLIETGEKSAQAKRQRPAMLYTINPDFKGYFYPRAIFS